MLDTDKKLNYKPIYLYLSSVAVGFDGPETEVASEILTVR
jgi:hypothetical protein